MSFCIRFGLRQRTAKDWRASCTTCPKLPQCAAAFAEGRLSWDQVKRHCLRALPAGPPKVRQSQDSRARTGVDILSYAMSGWTAPKFHVKRDILGCSPRCLSCRSAAVFSGRCQRSLAYQKPSDLVGVNDEITGVRLLVWSSRPAGRPRRQGHPHTHPSASNRTPSLNALWEPAPGVPGPHPAAHRGAFAIRLAAFMSYYNQDQPTGRSGWSLRYQAFQLNGEVILACPQWLAPRLSASGVTQID